ncbi:hypothetical protein VU08_05375 [Desulfobulbus sp. F5]|nr:hypothetical protein [Desulfobulbus sp. F5]
MKLPSLQSLKFFFFLILAIKIPAYFAIKFYYEILYIGGAEAGNDSEYYHAYAIGLVDHAVNIWPVILRFLNQYGLYNRDYVSIYLFILAVIFIPFFIAKLIKDERYNSICKEQRKIYWLVAIAMIFYPTIFTLTFDIYRDVKMIFIFAIFLYAFKVYTKTGKKYLLAIMISIAYILFLFRPYLGISLVLGFFVFKYNLNTKKILYLFIIYIIFIMLLKIYGYLDPILQYRGEEGFEEGGSSLGIGLMNKGSAQFIFLYIYSIAMQLFGLFINSWKAVAAFILESLLFIVLFFYIFKNRKYMTPFAKYLLFFSVIYGSIWIMGNDNLGTAVRLRIYNYISVYVIAGVIYLEIKLQVKGE